MEKTATLDYISSLDNIKEGAIFSHSWGYDQTNYDFYQVIKRTRTSVIVRRIQSEKIENDGHNMTAVLMPRIGVFSEQNPLPLTKRLKASSRDGRAYLSMEYGWCGLWDGKPKHATYYA